MKAKGKEVEDKVKPQAKSRIKPVVEETTDETKEVPSVKKSILEPVKEPPGEVVSEDKKEQIVVAEEEVQVEESENISAVLVFAIGFLVGAVLSGIVVYLVFGRSNESIQAPIEPTFEAVAPELPEVSKVVEEKVEVDYSDYSVQVLNGSGVAGAAGAASEILEGTGFKSLDIGNADDSYTKTEVSMKENVPSEMFDTVSGLLKEGYEVVAGEALDAEANYDVVIVVGTSQ